MQVLEIAAIFVFGSMVGSFLNVCMLRLPKDESIVFPASHCTSCQKRIAWYDNVPVLSFLALGACCRHCRAKISWQYPIVEVLTGVLFIVFYRTFGPTPRGFVYLYLTLALFVQAVIDTRYRIIPDGITLPAIAVGLAASVLFPGLHDESSRWRGLFASLEGVLLGGGFLYLVGTLAEFLLKKEAMGGGDVKLLAAIGAVIGWRGVLWTIFVSSFVGSIIGLYGKWKHGQELIPYGPFLALGAFLYIFFGPQAMDWYFSYLRGA